MGECGKRKIKIYLRLNNAMFMYFNFGKQTIYITALETQFTYQGGKLTSFWKSWKPRLLSNDTLTSAFPCNRATLAMIASVIPMTTCLDEIEGYVI